MENFKNSTNAVKEKDGDRTLSGVGTDNSADLIDVNFFWAEFCFDHFFHFQSGFFIIGMTDGDQLVSQ